MIIVASKKQSLRDLCIQVYGDTQHLFVFAKDNGLAIDSEVERSTELYYNDSIGNKKIVENIKKNNLNVINPTSYTTPPPRQLFIVNNGVFVTENGVFTTDNE